MPVIMALYLTLIAATGAMALDREGSWKLAALAMGLIAISPMTTLGAIYQLIAQVGGLSLLCVAVTLLFRPLATKPLSQLIISNVIAGVIIAALLIWYPEVLPFLVLGWLLYMVLAVKKIGPTGLEFLFQRSLLVSL